MTKRILNLSTFDVSPHLMATPLASPFRQLIAFLLDWILLLVPTFVVILLIAGVSLWITDTDAFRGILAILMDIQEQGERNKARAEVAPLLVRINAAGLPASVKLAIEESDFQRAGQLLEHYNFDLSLILMTNPPPLATDHIRIDFMQLIPNTIRGLALFGIAALYFTLFTAGSCVGTLGKRIFRIRVVCLDRKPLRYWNSFERFGGYLASLGTLVLGLLDLWRDPNRRLAHDRIANTVVIRKTV